MKAILYTSTRVKFDHPALTRITATVPGTIITEIVESDPVPKHKASEKETSQAQLETAITDEGTIATKRVKFYHPALPRISATVPGMIVPGSNYN